MDIIMRVCAGWWRWGAAAWICLWAANRTLAVEDPGWPRAFEAGGAKVVMYQPQVDEWKDHSKLTFRSAVAVTKPREKKENYGVLAVEVQTDTDFQDRSVLMHDFQIKEVRFPNLPEQEAAALERVVRDTLPKDRKVIVSLDRVLACVEQDPAQQRAVEVNLEPPAILYSSKPAVLMVFIGKPEFVSVKDTALMTAVNTNWDLFLDTGSNQYFLLNGESWLASPDPLKGPWTTPKSLPADLSKLPQDPNWEDVRKNIPGKQSKTVPTVFASTEAAELIVTTGAPKYSPIPPTRLMQVSNTESVLFLHSGEKQYYYLVAGRWFRAKSLDGPWTAASRDLPADFAKIPDQHETAFVKAAVPGTREARDAVLLASVPRKTAVKRAEATCTVAYDGAPRFVEIKGTTVKYAINSPNDVFLVDGGYYCCYQGVWFCGAGAAGPWAACEQVPQALYTIPPSHPKHNVTYVYIYDSTPDVVYVGYTSGYSGEYVAATRALMFGAGLVIGAALADDWDDDDWYYYHHYHFHVNYFSYGCGAVYHYGYSGYYRAAHYAGPYGGAGRGAIYNPATGGFARGAYRYGPAGSAFAREGYNPFTDTYGAQARVSTPYGSSGRFYAERGGTAVRGGYESGARGTVGWAQTSEGGQAAAWETARGQDAVAKGQEGNVYVGKDGNVYKRSENGSWSKNEGGSWSSVSGPGGRASARDHQDRAGRCAGHARPPAQLRGAPARQPQRPTRPYVQPKCRPWDGKKTVMDPPRRSAFKHQYKEHDYVKRQHHAWGIRYPSVARGLDGWSGRPGNDACRSGGRGGAVWGTLGQEAGEPHAN